MLNESAVLSIYSIPPRKVISEPKQPKHLKERHKSVIKAKSEILAIIRKAKSIYFLDLAKQYPKHETYVRSICNLLERDGLIISEKVLKDSRYHRKIKAITESL